jgi:hypothetical protein
MNERIKSMWEVATGSVWPMKGKFTAGEYDHNLEKFAELIVSECAKFLDDNSGLYICNNVGSPTPKELLQHFGVKE